MNIQLDCLTLSQLQQLASGCTAIGDVHVATNAVPDFLVTAAIEDLKRDCPAVWHSLFLYVSAEKKMALGSAAFKGMHVDGRVDVGYGVLEAYRGQGIATQGLIHMTAVAFSEPGVAQVYAENAIDNLASARVLMKAGFKRIGQRESADDGLVDCWVVSRS